MQKTDFNLSIMVFYYFQFLVSILRIELPVTEPCSIVLTAISTVRYILY